MPRFSVRDEAEADIAEAYAWYEARSDGLGEQFLAAIDTALAAIQAGPLRYPVLHQEPDLAIRRVLVERFPYGLFFIYDDASDELSVIACMHARRDPRRWLDRA